LGGRTKKVHKLVVANFKGGVGKTTLTVNLCTVLTQGLGKSVLLVDTDPSANVTAQLKIRPTHTLAELILGEISAQAAITAVPEYGNLHIIGSSRATQAAEFRITSQVGRERILAKRLKDAPRFDYVVFDTPPSISIMAQNAFVCADQVLIPVSMDPMSLLGASTTIGLLSEIREALDIDCSLAGIVPTFVDRRLIITRVVMDAIRSRFNGTPILPGIRTDTAVRKATASQIPIVKYAPGSRASKDFAELARTLDRRLSQERPNE
jgi:chromosome partitioning protein